MNNGAYTTSRNYSNSLQINSLNIHTKKLHKMAAVELCLPNMTKLQLIKYILKKKSSK